MGVTWGDAFLGVTWGDAFLGVVCGDAFLGVVCGDTLGVRCAGVFFGVGVACMAASGEAAALLLVADFGLVFGDERLAGVPGDLDFERLGLRFRRPRTGVCTTTSDSSMMTVCRRTYPRQQNGATIICLY